ncbi:hypothetical protein MIND_01072400 [Mycena indigotica]|uniref:Uncharacterized protein n=1 Tax=Mycena indigotica TaxID=2126181 RepID=A0A8H6SAV1_9AGAR|nr:uncharacterized protein MIND_01072400 [Mycena indigotica]KAF7295331.1 hypothetical protein MIND_01072400 [Mycena indigotica]
MSRVLFQSTSPYAHTVNITKRWAASLGIWGVGAGAGAFLFLSVTPLVRREVLVKIPVLNWYYEDKTPASDKPF